MIYDLEPWYPLHLGHTTVYLINDPELPAGGGKLTRRVVASERRDAGLYAIVRESLGTDGPGSARELPALVSIIGVREGDRWILMPPLKVGTSWEDGPDAMEITAVGEWVKVPAGNFADCVKVVYTNEDTGGGTLWLARDVGLLKAEQFGERGPFTLELESAFLSR